MTARPAPPEPRSPRVPRVEHGGPDFAELATLGIRPEAILDFSVNKNPLGASPRALRALDLVEPSAYPDARCLRLRAGLAAAHDVRPDEVLVGNGSVELIWLLGQVYLGPGDGALIVGPTFGEYEAAARRAGAEIVQVDAKESDGFRPDVQAITETIRRTDPRLVFLCNPNNPTGQVLEPDEIRTLLDALGDGLLVVDEAYVELADGVESVDVARPQRPTAGGAALADQESRAGRAAARLPGRATGECRRGGERRAAALERQRVRPGGRDGGARRRGARGRGTAAGAARAGVAGGRAGAAWACRACRLGRATGWSRSGTAARCATSCCGAGSWCGMRARSGCRRTSAWRCARSTSASDCWRCWAG